MMTHKKQTSRKAKKSGVNAVKTNTAEEGYYVGVADHVDVRRAVLESMREAVHFLQRSEKLRGIREEKAHTIQQLKGDLKELSTLVNHLKKTLPKSAPGINWHLKHGHKFKCLVCDASFNSPPALEKHLKTVHKPKDEKQEELPEEKPENELEETSSAVEEVGEVPKKQSPSELENLERELSDIETQLDKMS